MYRDSSSHFPKGQVVGEGEGSWARILRNKRNIPVSTNHQIATWQCSTLPLPNTVHKANLGGSFGRTVE